MYTEPNDEGLWHYHKWGKRWEVYLKIYSSFFDIHFSKPIDGKVILEINGEETIIEIEYKRMILKIERRLVLGDNIGIRYNNEYIRIDIHQGNVLDAFVDELLELDESCRFALLEKLEITSDPRKRESIIKKLISADPLRKNYYLSLNESFIIFK
ncbi:hypothetical protein TCON_2312 [Astathelohania contejeani]|uniref:Uncharacterized protein n=1 Tax=Astathelohania contejeani TaxID=164912 RepID=A0ABQ7HWC9_9MICR|nr:hypothetical protein TCON_2312 [Thelohania contejeani]